MLEKLVAKHQKSFGDLDRQIVKYMLNNKEALRDLSITDLADATYTSKSTVLRLVKKLGFSGYSEFKYNLRMARASSAENSGGGVDVVSIQATDILRTLEIMEQVDWSDIIEALQNAQTIYAYGTVFFQRKALDEFSKVLLPMGKKVIVIPNKTELDMSMPIITQSDLVLVASLSGETPRMKDNLLSLELRQIPVISVTRLGENFMAQHSDYALHYQTSTVFLAPNHPFESLLSLSVALDYMSRKWIEYIFSR